MSALPLYGIADGYEMTQQQVVFLEDYKKITLLCEKSPACRKNNQRTTQLKAPSLLQMELNLKNMAEDLMRI